MEKLFQVVPKARVENGIEQDPVENAMARTDTTFGNADTLRLVMPQGTLFTVSGKRVIVLVRMMRELLLNAVDASPAKSVITTEVMPSGLIVVRNDVTPTPLTASHIDFTEVHCLDKDGFIAKRVPGPGDRPLPRASLLAGMMNIGTNFDDTTERLVAGRNGIGLKGTNQLCSTMRFTFCDGRRTYVGYFRQFRRHHWEIQQTPGSKMFAEVAILPNYFYFLDDPSWTVEDQNALTTAVVKSMAGITEAIARPLPMRHFEGIFHAVKALVTTYSAIHNRVYHIQTPIDSAPVVCPDRAAFIEKALEEGTYIRVCNASVDLVVSSVPRLDTSGNESQEGLILSAISAVNGVDVSTGIHMTTAHSALADLIAKATKTSSMKLDRILSISVSCEVPNPCYDAQWKDKFTSYKEDGKDVSSVSNILKLISTTPGSTKLRSWILKSPIAERVMAIQEAAAKKADAAIIRKAVNAGVSKSVGVLSGRSGGLAFICEGTSAKNYLDTMMSILELYDSEAFELTGKPLNVVQNELVKGGEMNKALGGLLTNIGIDITLSGQRQLSRMRYKAVIIAADADTDGWHIVALVVAFFMKFVPDLIKTGRLFVLATPVIRTGRRVGKTKFQQQNAFFTQSEFVNATRDLTRDRISSKLGPHIRYLKGLGSSTNDDVRVDSRDVRLLRIVATEGAKSAFNEMLDDDAGIRRAAIELQCGNITDDIDMTSPFKDAVINKFLRWHQCFDFPLEMLCKVLVMYYIYILRRAIPGPDTLKDCQRKIISVLCMHPEAIADEVKTNEFGAIVAKETHYAHGDSVLHETILSNGSLHECHGMTISPYVAIGQCGSRAYHMKKSAHPRYVHVVISECWDKIIFTDLVKFIPRVITDGTPCDISFVPFLVPYVLVNGIKGTAAGWRSKVLKYDIFKLIDVACAILSPELPGSSDALKHPVTHFYRGYTGPYVTASNRLHTFMKTNPPLHEIFRAFAENPDAVVKFEIVELPVTSLKEKVSLQLNTLRERGDIREYCIRQFDQKISIQITDLKGLKTMLALPLMDSALTTEINIIGENGVPATHTPVSLIRQHIGIMLRYIRDFHASNISKITSDVAALRERIAKVSVMVVIAEQEPMTFVAMVRDQKHQGWNDLGIKYSGAFIQSCSKQGVAELEKTLAELLKELAKWESLTPELIFRKKLLELRDFLKGESIQYGEPDATHCVTDVRPVLSMLKGGAKMPEITSIGLKLLQEIMSGKVRHFFAP